MPKLNQRGVIAQALMLLILIAGIIGGLYLVKHPQIFKPKASSDSVEWIQTSDDPDNCVTSTGNNATTNCPKVKFRINVPAEVTK